MILRLVFLLQYWRVTNRLINTKQLHWTQNESNGYTNSTVQTNKLHLQLCTIDMRRMQLATKTLPYKSQLCHRSLTSMHYRVEQKIA